jgi:hypothetical protein
VLLDRNHHVEGLGATVTTGVEIPARIVEPAALFVVDNSVDVVETRDVGAKIPAVLARNVIRNVSLAPGARSPIVQVRVVLL